jgi:hypothetical protein
MNCRYEPNIALHQGTSAVITNIKKEGIKNSLVNITASMISDQNILTLKISSGLYVT